MKTMKILTAGALALSLAAPASAQMLLKGYDVDGDGQLTGAEFRDLFDADGMVNAAAYDTDGDGYLTQAEFEAGFGPYAEYWQTAGYGTLTFTDWDLNADGLVDDGEIYENYVRVYDADGSGTIDESEFGILSTDMQELGVTTERTDEATSADM